MQTFLPYNNFKKTAACLDIRCLAEQRVEAYQIRRIIADKPTSAGWLTHTAVLTWKGFSGPLASYHNSMIYVCERLDAEEFLEKSRFPIEPSGLS